MGMYTELALGVRLKEDTPEDVIKVLDYMTVSKRGDPVPLLPDHPLFKTDRWDWMLRSAGSYYFEAEPCLTWKRDDLDRHWCLTVWTNIKNYCNEWERFLDWLSPYIDASKTCPEHVGHMRYEESTEPTILYCCGGVVYQGLPGGNEG